MIELDILHHLLKLNQKDMKIVLETFIKSFFKDEEIFIADSYIFCKGKYPILLVAHIDTVYDHKFYNCAGNDFTNSDFSKKKIFFDSNEKIIWSPEGLGADDRAGIFIIIKLLLSGLRPYILFTTDEEIGRKGAKQFAQDFLKMLRLTSL